MCIGVEEEGLIYSKLCNHLGNCWLGADCSIVAELYVAASRTLVFPESRGSIEASPSLSFSLLLASHNPPPPPFSVWHLYQEERLNRLLQVLTEAHLRQRGNSLLILPHNSCCISSNTGKLSSMFHELAM